MIKSTLEEKKDDELERLAADGFFPCGLSNTWEPCPQCCSLLGRFRAGMAGQKFYSPKKGQTYMSEIERRGLYCRACRVYYEG